MRNILIKEMRLTALFLTYALILFGLMFFLPGYPILCGAFFVTLGIYQTYLSMKETNDILFSALLPIAKRDVVKGKYIFASVIELCGLGVMGVAVILRSTVFLDAPVYRANALMNANCFALGLALVIFGVFNVVFIGGFFRTAYKTGKPFIVYMIIAFAIIGAGETLQHIPGFEVLNAFGTEHIAMQLILLGCGAFAYIIMTGISYCKASGDFDKIDL